MKYIKSFFLSAAAALFPAVSFAVPAKPGIVSAEQPDGSTIDVRITGDERGHTIFSADGYLLIANSDGYFYATQDAEGKTVNSGVRAVNADRRSPETVKFLSGLDRESMRRAAISRLGVTRREAAKAKAAKAAAKVPATMLTNNFPSTGHQKAVVILVQYKDLDFKLNDPYDYFSKMLNEEGFSQYGGTGCAREYFNLCSGGKFDPEFDVYGPVTLSRNMSYYGANDVYGNDLHPEEMVIEACQQLDGEVDFSQYDRDGDGVIDNVFVIYAGRGEASGGSKNTVWPHAYNIYGALKKTFYFDGVLLDHYGCTNEWLQSGPDGVGTFIHEFSHVMGLPDLYDTTYETDNFTPCEWSALDVGPYNNNGRTPPLYSAFERMSMGWITPMPITSAGEINLLPISSDLAYYIPTAKANEFFLVENRQNESWDKYLPGHGMLVWHVDYNATVWQRNAVNDTDGHPRVHIEAAGGAHFDQAYYGSATDPFPGAGNKTSFTDDTTPSMKSWSNKRQETPLTNIKENDLIVSFTVKGGLSDLAAAPEALDAKEIAGTRFTACWKPVENATAYTVTLSDDNSMFPKYFHVDGSDASSLEITGLTPETYYYYSVMARSESSSTPLSNEIEVLTTEATLSDLAMTAAEATDVTATSFTANWQPEPLANDYIITVSEFTPASAFSTTASFGGKLPEGWSSTSETFGKSGTLSGIQLSPDRNVLTSPVYEAGITAASFKHYPMASSAINNEIEISFLVGDKWVDSDQKDYPNIGVKTCTVRNIPEGCKAIRITYNATVKADILVGEFAISGGSDKEYSAPLSGYTDLHTGNVGSISVKGLKPGTVYVYTVKATDGEAVTAPSETIRVKTLEESAIDEITDGATERIIPVPGGVEVTGNVRVDIFNATGAHLYSGPAGYISLSVGFYIVRIPGSTVKISVR